VFLERLADWILRHRALALVALLAATALFGRALYPLQYDFSFAALFIGEGEDYDQLRDYLNRFGSDVNFVVVAAESDTLYSHDRMAQIDALATSIAALEGVEDVVSPTNAEDMVGGNGELRMQRLVPHPLPDDPAEWDAIRDAATSHRLLGGTVYGVEGRHAAILVRYGIETSPDACSDGIDNDANGQVDCHDASCFGNQSHDACAPAASETTNAACTNGVDDDEDGALDCADPDCAELAACAWVGSDESSRGACRDDIDNDGDGRIDCADPDCARNPDVPYCHTTLAVERLVDDARTDDLQLYIGGVPWVSEAYTRVIQHDLKTFLPITSILVAIVLGMLFRNVPGVVLPGAVVGLGIVWAIGFMMLTGGKLNIINSVMPTLLLVIAVADTVHVIARWMEEAGRFDDRRDLAQYTMRRMTVACALTSLTSAVGFGTLVTARLPIIRDFGMYSAAGILLAFGVMLLLMPPVLSMLPVPKQRAHGDGWFGRGADAFAGACVRLAIDRPRVVGVLTAVVVLGAVFGVTLVRQNSRMTEELHPAHPVSVANAEIEAHLGGVLSGAVVFEGPPEAFTDPDVLALLDEIGTFAEDWRAPHTGDPLVGRAVSIAPVIAEAHADWRGVDEPSIPDTAAGVAALLDQVPVDERQRLVSADYSVAHVTFRMYDGGSAAWSALQSELRARLDAGVAGLDVPIEWRITGSSTLGQNAMGYMVRDLVSSLLLAVLIIVALMSILFRSVKLGIISMIPNLLPILMTLGAVGYFGVELRVSTAVVFSISLGIAVDDTIHVLVRLREELARGEGTYADAMERAVRSAGRAVLFTTLLLCAGFGILGMSEFTAVRELAMLGGVTLLSAVFGDLVVLPWVLVRLHPDVGRLDHSGEGGGPATAPADSTPGRANSD